MRTLIVLCCIAFAAAKPSGFLHYAAPAGVVTGPVSVSSQYHAQDALGQYSYGYSSDVSSKVESKTFDGITRGGYSYVDGNGLVQSANYVADDLNGFNVAATNLPKHVISQVQDTPEVSAAKAAHAVAYNEAAVAAAVAPDVSESVVVAAPAVSSYIGGYVAPAVSSYVAPAVSVVKDFPSKAFSYSTVAASPAVSHVAVSPAVSHVAVSPVVSSRVAYDGVAVAPAVNVLKDVSSKAFSYSTVDASPVVGLNVASVPAAVSYSVGAENIPVVKVEQNVPVVSVKSHVPVSAVSYSVPVGVGTGHQYHAQDALGQYSYGYSGGPSAKAESKTFDGVTRGGYSYVDGNGLVQSANYVADDAHGFRVAATNLPIGPDQSVLHNIGVSPIAVSPFVVGQQVVGDTPEVTAAKAAHFAAHAAAKYHHDYYYDY